MNTHVPCLEKNKEKQGGRERERERHVEEDMTERALFRFVVRAASGLTPEIKSQDH